jgi:hypothetical protein
MRKILMVSTDLVKSMHPEPKKMPIRQKLIMILKDRVACAATDQDRERVRRELLDYTSSTRDTQD